MRKVVVMSDNHGQQACLERIKVLEPHADYYIHCGDSEADEGLLKSFYAVAGNNDWYTNLPEELILEIEDCRFFVSHGHRTGYMNRLETLSIQAKERNCNVALFGHIHMPVIEKSNGVLIVNPGSTTLPRGGSKPSYAYISVDGIEVNVEIKNFTW